jgi:type VI protein secretion system component Hcp
MLRRTRLLATSSVLAVGLTLSGGYLVNAATAPTTTITACSNTKTGAVRVVSPKTACAKTEKRLVWNVKGATGATGAVGKTGAAGAPGENGLPGPAGKDGINGADGKDGIDGIDGADGKDGAPGPAGPGAEVADPNPHDVTYRMSFANTYQGGYTPINGFTQRFTQSGSTHMGDGGGAGKANVGDVEVTLPMNSDLIARMTQLAKGSHTTTARLEMCLPGELIGEAAPAGAPAGAPDRRTGRCTLSVELQEVMVTEVSVNQDPDAETVTMHLNSALETVTHYPTTGAPMSLDLNIAENTSGLQGAIAATDDGDTTYTTTLTGANGPLGVLPTERWSQSMTQSGTTHMGAGGGAGKANFGDLAARTRTGAGTVTLLDALFRGIHFPKAQVDGCITATCSSKMTMTDVLVTGVDIGSPSLFDDITLNYGVIKWERNEDNKRPANTRTFDWNVAANAGS